MLLNIFIMHLRLFCWVSRGFPTPYILVHNSVQFTKGRRLNVFKVYIPLLQYMTGRNVVGVDPQWGAQMGGRKGL